MASLGICKAFSRHAHKPGIPGPSRSVFMTVFRSSSIESIACASKSLIQAPRPKGFLDYFSREKGVVGNPRKLKGTLGQQCLLECGKCGIPRVMTLLPQKKWGLEGTQALGLQTWPSVTCVGLLSPQSEPGLDRDNCLFKLVHATHQCLRLGLA